MFGYSLPRITLALFLFVPSVLFTYFAVKVWLEGGQSNWFSNSSKKFVKSNSRFWIFFGFGNLFLFISWVLFFLPEKRAILWFGSFSLYMAVAKPLLLYGMGLSLLVTTNLLAARYGIDLRKLQPDKKNIRLGLLLFLGFLIFVAIVTISGIGLGFDASIWNAPGTPVLSSQVFSVLLGASLLMFPFWLETWLQKRVSSKSSSSFYLDVGLAFFIWLLAAVLWLIQPAASTYYDTQPLPPNYQSYPLSDAFNHDVIANNVLIGEGFRFGGQIAIRRPVYVMFLAGLEALLGANYDAVVVGQVLVLALFPALLYILGTKLHGRLAGALVAGIITFREANSIILGDVINTSHAKLLMADLPSAMMMAGLVLGVFVWMRRDSHNVLGPLLVGGLLGWSIMLRSQSLTLLPFLVLLAFLVWGWRSAWRPILLILLGVSLLAGPWIIRNRVQMGQWAIEDAVVSGFLANRYSFTPGAYAMPFLAGESEGDYYARQMAHVRDFTFLNPGYVIGFVADNFIRNQLLNFLAPPLSLQLRDLESHVRELPYWPGWEGELATESYLPLAANLALVSLGIAFAWRRFRWLGLAPLFINIGFTLNLALARVSGWRYNLPIDWTVLLYYAIGIAQIAYWILLVMNNSFAKRLITTTPRKPISKRAQSSPKTFQIRSVLVVIITLGLLGSSFFLIEFLSHPRYSRLSNPEATFLIKTSEIQNAELEAEREQLADLLEADLITVLSGRALHPRYYRAGGGEPGREFVLIDPMDFERFTFYLIGPDPASVVLRVASPDIEFPASSDVVVFRCGNTLEAAALVVKAGESISELYISTDLAQSCPLVVQ